MDVMLNMRRKRSAPSFARPDEGSSSFEESVSSAQRNPTFHTQRPPYLPLTNRYTSVGEPASKRQRTSMDLNDRSILDSDRYGQRPYMDQRILSAYTARDQTANAFSSPAYSQGPQSTLSNVSDYSYGHQRTNSSSTSSPFVSPHTDVSSQSWSTANVFYPSMKDASFTYQQSQFPDMQVGRASHLGEHFMRQRDQNFTNRLPMSTNFSIHRPQETDNTAVGTFNQLARSLPMSSHNTNLSARILPAEQMANLSSPDRQQYPSTPISNVLPPLESTISSQQNRSGSQQILPSTVLPSIEPQTLDPTPNLQVHDHGQESFDAHESYVPTSFNFPQPNQKRPEDD